MTVEETKNSLDEIMNRFFELEKSVGEIRWEIDEKVGAVESNLDRVIELQAQQLDRLNKNLELTNAILGEISVGLSKGE